jgi:hypothetical protein
MSAMFMRAATQRVTGALAAIAFTIGAVVPVHTAAGGQDLSTLSIEDLLNIEVVSASRKEQPAGDVPAAIFSNDVGASLQPTACTRWMPSSTQRVRPRAALEFFGQNLRRGPHSEVVQTPILGTTRVPRAASARLTWRF